MDLIDTHAHIYLDEFDNAVQDVVQRSKEAGVGRVYLPNIDSGTIEDMIQLEALYPGFFYPMIGLHPTSVKKDYEKELEILKNWLHERSFAAIGETGIDLYWDKTHQKEQEKAFEIQIRWAKEQGMPIVIHSRDSFREIFDVVDRLNDEQLYGIFHSFAGTVEDAQHIIGLGFKIGINGIVTFKNSSLDEVVAEIDMDHLVLETDAPFLAPVPHRGKRNESTYIKYIAKKIAEVKNISLEEVAEITTRNALKVFRS
ncbi:MAG: TatD family hydrolase [Bacteroidales bacterium]|nr:TatD family hydrolase [Bacteroidales bacterium]MBS3773608.1 TatD family hydrolase [Bacteroidales bacterium]